MLSIPKRLYKIVTWIALTPGVPADNISMQGSHAVRPMLLASSCLVTEPEDRHS